MPIPDQFHHLIQKLIDKEQPQSMEELQAILDRLIGQPLPEIPKEDLTEADKALELVWEAWELPPDKGRRRAQKALKINPDCIEAYEYLGSTYTYIDKAQPLFEKGVEIGRRIFGGDFLKANKGHFWGITETRSFMRCLDNLARCYYGPGRTAQAIPLWEELLDLNPDDNQGIRYQLLPALLEIKDLKNFRIHHKKYKENSAMMLYTEALALFMELGEGEKANFALGKAVKSNPFLPPLLLATYPPNALPDAYAPHSEEEAIIYTSLAWRAWSWNTGAKDWLRRKG